MKRMQCVPLRGHTVECHHPIPIAISVCTCAFLEPPWRPSGCTTVISVPGRSLSPGCRLDPSARPELFARPKFGAQRTKLSVSHIIVRTRIPPRPSRHETKPTHTHAHAHNVRLHNQHTPTRTQQSVFVLYGRHVGPRLLAVQALRSLASDLAVA